MRRHRLLRRAAAPALASCWPSPSMLLDGAGSWPIGPRSAPPPRSGRASPGIKPLTHEVYGYLPYWRLDSGTVDRLHYELVSSIAFFGLGIKSNGALDTGWVGYKEYVGDDAAAVTNAAHDRGVRVVPTFQLFDSASGYPKMTKFLKSTAAQDRFIAEALDLMAARKADGAGLDFEPVGALEPARQVLRRRSSQRFRDGDEGALPRRDPRERAVRRGQRADHQGARRRRRPRDGHDLQLPLVAARRSPGAIAPLDHAARNVKIHIAADPPVGARGVLLLGVPYYGYNWPVTSKVPNAAVQKRQEEVRRGLESSPTRAPATGSRPTRRRTRKYDALEGSAFYTYWSTKYKTYRQVYFEEEQQPRRQVRLRDRDRARRHRHLDARQRQGLRRPVERPARQVLRAGPRGPRQGQGRRCRRSDGIVYATIRAVRPRDRHRPRARPLEVDAPRQRRARSSGRGAAKKQTLYPTRLATADPEGPARLDGRPEGGHLHAAASGSSRSRRPGARPSSRSTSGTEPGPDELPSRMRRDTSKHLARGPTSHGHASITYRPIAFAAVAACVAGRGGGDADPGPAAGGPRGRRRRPDHTTRRLGAWGPRDDSAAIDCDGRDADPSGEPVSDSTDLQDPVAWGRRGPATSWRMSRTRRDPSPGDRATVVAQRAAMSPELEELRIEPDVLVVWRDLPAPAGWKRQIRQHLGQECAEMIEVHRAEEGRIGLVDLAACPDEPAACAVLGRMSQAIDRLAVDRADADRCVASSRGRACADTITDGSLGCRWLDRHCRSVQGSVLLRVTGCPPLYPRQERPQNLVLGGPTPTPAERPLSWCQGSGPKVGQCDRRPRA